MHLDHDTRVGAHVLVVKHGALLLAHFRTPHVARWTLPGGGLEVGEDPATAAKREAWEETGYEVVLDGLVATQSEHLPAGTVGSRPLHSLRIVYRARVSGGALRPEVQGTTDDARWVSLDELDALRRAPLVDAALTAWRRAGAAAAAD